MDRLPGTDTAFPNGSIHTDYLHRILVDGPPPMDGGVDAGMFDAGPTSDPGRDALIHFIGANHLAVRNSDGYRVDDLHGLWATAPYLHNGSVPTLDALFAASAAMRPVTFMRGTIRDRHHAAGEQQPRPRVPERRISGDRSHRARRVSHEPVR